MLNLTKLRLIRAELDEAARVAEEGRDEGDDEDHVRTREADDRPPMHRDRRRLEVRPGSVVARDGGRYWQCSLFIGGESGTRLGSVASLLTLNHPCQCKNRALIRPLLSKNGYETERRGRAPCLKG